MQNKIGVISDIHGNSHALKVVLEKAKCLGISKLLFLGDIVGYYYEPGECLEMLSDWDVEYIRGNHEIMLKEMILGTTTKQSIITKYGHGLAIAEEQLTEDQIDFLISLPDFKFVQAGTKTLLLCHGTPWDRDEYLYPDCPENIFDKCNSKGTDFLFCGHTHYQMIKKLSYTTIINPGSVGQPRDRLQGAAWATIRLDCEEVKLHREPYDFSSLFVQIEKNDPLSEYHKEVFTRQ